MLKAFKSITLSRKKKTDAKLNEKKKKDESQAVRNGGAKTSPRPNMYGPATDDDTVVPVSRSILSKHSILQRPPPSPEFFFSDASVQGAAAAAATERRAARAAETAAASARRATAAATAGQRVAHGRPEAHVQNGPHREPKFGQNEENRLRIVQLSEERGQ